MTAKKLDIRAVPTNIITGFLGVGKTSTIQELLKKKPAGERWAVLVNEFGEIGIDGSLLSGQQPEESGVFIREVPGGCMCCASGLPMQIALNHLLMTARPERLLIEPTGLGHPKEVLQVLSSEHYQETLSLQKTLTLVDARDLKDERYTNHETFNQQIAIADTVIGNKADLYTDEDRQRLRGYVAHHGADQVDITFAVYGDISLNVLAGKTTTQFLEHHHHHSHANKPLLSEAPIPHCGFIKAANEGEGFNSVGWRFAPDTTFDNDKLREFLMSIDAERMKAVFITTEGLFGYNLDKGALLELDLLSCEESRIEIIAETLSPGLESDLMRCIHSAPVTT